MTEANLLNVVLPTEHLEETRSFFESNFSFDVMHESEDAVFFDCGEVSLVVHDVDSESFTRERPGAFYIDLRVDDLEAFREQVDGGAVEDQWEDDIGEFLLMKEPNGNFLEVLEFAD